MMTFVYICEVKFSVCWVGAALMITWQDGRPQHMWHSEFPFSGLYAVGPLGIEKLISHLRYERAPLAWR